MICSLIPGFLISVLYNFQRVESRLYMDVRLNYLNVYLKEKEGPLIHSLNIIYWMSFFVKSFILSTGEMPDKQDSRINEYIIKVLYHQIVINAMKKIKVIETDSCG